MPQNILHHINTLMGVTKRDPLMLESVTWLSSTDVMISSAPAIMAMSRVGCADSWKSVWFQKSMTLQKKERESGDIVCFKRRLVPSLGSTKNGTQKCVSVDRLGTLLPGVTKNTQKILLMEYYTLT